MTKKTVSDEQVLRQFDAARRAVDILDARVERLQQLRNSRHALARWWGGVRSPVVIEAALEARDWLITCRRVARRRGLLNHRA